MLSGATPALAQSSGGPRVLQREHFGAGHRHRQGCRDFDSWAAATRSEFSRLVVGRVFEKPCVVGLGADLVKAELGVTILSDVAFGRPWESLRAEQPASATGAG
jgi:hypothetical protein